MTIPETDVSCPCGSGQPFSACCGPVLADPKAAATAEALMRSRYSAFARKNLEHLEATLAPEALHDYDRSQTEALAAQAAWTGLEILRTEAGSADDSTGVVEFLARYMLDNKAMVHHETAMFRRGEAGEWLYVDGHMGPSPRRVEKVGRNDPCPCGSGKKYKKCHGA